MNFQEVANTGIVEYDFFEKQLLLKTNPSKLGQPFSDLELLALYKDIFIKFDFTIIYPKPNLESYINSIIEKIPDKITEEKNEADKIYSIREILRIRINQLVESDESEINFIQTKKENNENRILNEGIKNALTKIEAIFPKESTILLYGSSLSNKNPSDYDFRIIIPHLTKDEYKKYLSFARDLRNLDIPITYGLINKFDFKNIQISDEFNLYNSNKTLILKGEIPIYESDLTTKLKFVRIGQVLSKTRESLVKKYLYSILTVIKARRNEAYHLNNMLKDMFEDKGLTPLKYSEKTFSPKEAEKRLISANEDLLEIISTYKQEIKEYLQLK